MPDDGLRPISLDALEPLDSLDTKPAQKSMDSISDRDAVKTLSSHNLPMPSDIEMPPLDDMSIEDLMLIARKIKASDIHITAGLAPVFRVDGVLYSMAMDVLDNNLLQRIVYDALSDEQVTKFENTKELDISFGTDATGRFRVNLYKQKANICCAMRAIPTKIPSFEDLKLPEVIRSFTELHSGLILVTGQTGSGKSTTIAAMIDAINSKTYKHILTIEDPIEFVHQHKCSMVNQREIGSDSESFHNSIRAALREDPDVILLGEMRDLETIQAALTLAETGHLVFGTLHTRNAPQTVDRVIDVFSPEQQEQIRVLLANTLQAVVAQQLVPVIGGGRTAALEIMIATSAIRNLIREAKTHQIYSMMETSKGIGMQTMDSSLAALVKARKIDMEGALGRCMDKDNLLRLISAI
ncbi:MAG: type IV pilus twitching motility protein PilT [Armatimonadota bacterium]